jgi:outer membrane protein assembly factor BamB
MDGYLYAVDAETGKEKWRFETGYDDKWPPSIADGVVYFRGKGLLYALDSKTGKEKWRFCLEEEGDSVSASPAIADGVLYLRSNHGYLYAIR